MKSLSRVANSTILGWLMEAKMTWWKGRRSRIAATPVRADGWFRREPSTAGTVPGAAISVRDYPGQITSRTLRNDIYQDALRAAETTLRNSVRKA